MKSERSVRAISSINRTIIGCALFAVFSISAVAEFNYPSPPAEGEPDFFTIAEDGVAKCVIVRPASPADLELHCAETLKVYLELTTGAKFRTILDSGSVPAGMGAIHVGGTRLARKLDLRLPPVRYGDVSMPNVNGYMVETVDERTLVIRGGDGKATLLGVVGFLKRYAGVRRYWPGEPGGLGDSIVSSPTLRLPRIEWRDWPYFLSRIMSGVDHGPKPGPGFNRVRFADFLRMNYTIPSNESYYRWLPPSKYRETNPEYFPLIEGRRFLDFTKDGAGWQPCVSNPEVADIMAEALKQHFRDNPEAIAINLAVNDGMGDCECPDCLAMDAPGADINNRIGLSDRYIKFSNRVCEILAREFPDKIVAFIAYGSMRFPPETVKPHPMLMPVICYNTGNSFQMWDDWMATGAGHMGYYFYHDDHGWFVLPRLDIRQSAKRIRYAVASGVARHFYQEFYGVWPLDGMVAYVENELLWDPRLDVDSIVDEYYERFYGAAARDMARFYDALETGYTRYIEEEGEPHPHGKDLYALLDSKSYEQFKTLNAAESAAAREALDAAAKAAADDETIAGRIQIVDAIFGFSEMAAKQYRTMLNLENAAVADTERAGETMADIRRVNSLGLKLAEYKRTVLEEPVVKAYYGKSPRDTFYAAFDVDALPPRARQAIDKGLEAIAAGLRGELGAENAAGWINKQLETEESEYLRGALKAAELKAGGKELENIVTDPGFEKRGAASAGAAPTAENDELAPEHENRNGLHLWHSSGSAMYATITDREAHSGKYSVEFRDTQSACVSESLRVAPGERYSLSAWVKHNTIKGRYTVSVIPRSKEKMLDRLDVQVPWSPDEWQQVKVDFMVPPDAVTISLNVFANRQAPGGKVWVDDFFIGKYPN